MLTFEVEAFLRPRAVDDLDLLGEQGEALAQRRERKSVLEVLALVPSGPEPELDPAL